MKEEWTGTLWWSGIYDVIYMPLYVCPNIEDYVGEIINHNLNNREK